MSEWSEVLVRAFDKVPGGVGTLDEIYEAVSKTRGQLTPHWRATVRCKLQAFSSNSSIWRKKSSRDDLFYNANHGIWGLRDKLNDPTAIERLYQFGVATTDILVPLLETTHAELVKTKLDLTEIKVVLDHTKADLEFTKVALSHTRVALRYHRIAVKTTGRRARAPGVFITKAQRAELIMRGYTEDQVQNMVPAEAHKILAPRS